MHFRVMSTDQKVLFLRYKYKTSKYYLQLKFTIHSITLVVKIIIRTVGFLIPIMNIISSFEVSRTAHAAWLSLKNCFLLAHPLCFILPFVSVFNTVHTVFDSYLSFCFSAPLGLLRHGSAQGSGCFGKLHPHGFDGRQVSGDLFHWSLVWTGSVGNPGGRQILQGVWGSAAQADAQFSRLEDGQGQAVPVG